MTLAANPPSSATADTPIYYTSIYYTSGGAAADPTVRACAEKYKWSQVETTLRQPGPSSRGGCNPATCCGGLSRTRLPSQDVGLRNLPAERSAERAARSAAAVALSDTAAAVGVDAAELRSRVERLGRVGGRGRCARLLAEAAADPVTADAALTHRSCPPPTKRIADKDAPAPGAAGWALHHFNSGSPRGVIARWAHRADSGPVAAAANPLTPPAVLAALAADPDAWVRAAVAANPRCPPETINKLATDTEHHVRIAIAASAACPPHSMHLLTVDPDDGVRASLAFNLRCPPQVLRSLALAAQPHQRSAVAWHPRCPPDLLVSLATTDPDPGVRSQAASNPAIGKRVLAELAASNDWHAHAGMAMNPALPAALFEQLVGHAQSEVRAQMAGRGNFADGQVERLAADCDADVRSAVADNPETPQETLRRLASDRDGAVREAVAANPACPLDTLQRLAVDSRSDVRIEARQQLRYRSV